MTSLDEILRHAQTTKKRVLGQKRSLDSIFGPWSTICILPCPSSYESVQYSTGGGESIEWSTHDGEFGELDESEMDERKSSIRSMPDFSDMILSQIASGEPNDGSKKSNCWFTQRHVGSFIIRFI